MNISFGANYIKSVDIIHKQGSTSTFKKASFVEIDVNDKNDVEALNGIADDWGDKSYIMLLVKDVIDNTPKKAFLNSHIYAVTKQGKSFEKLNKDDILGAVVFTEGKKANEIDALQVQPDNLGSLSGDGYKRVGTSIITTLQEMYPKKPMKVTSSHDAIGFYEKCGFKSTGVNLKYVWNA